MPDIVTMFFVLGVIAGLVRSDLEVPKAAYDLLSLLLMLTIGLKGGIALHGNITPELLIRLAGIISLGFMIPLVLYPIMRRLVRLGPSDAASFIAHYGSVSAGTFAVALAYTQTHQRMIGGDVTLFLVVLELPAILVAIILYNFLHRGRNAQKNASLTPIILESLTNRSVILLVGGMLIGWLYGPQQGLEVTGILMGAFTVVLALFLLNMGLTAAEALRGIRRSHWRVLTFAFSSDGPGLVWAEHGSFAWVARRFAAHFDHFNRQRFLHCRSSGHAPCHSAGRWWFGDARGARGYFPLQCVGGHPAL